MEWTESATMAVAPIADYVNNFTFKWLCRPICSTCDVCKRVKMAYAFDKL